MVNSIEQKKLPIDQRALAIARRPVDLKTKINRLSQVLRHYDSIQILRRGSNLLARKFQPGKRVGKIASDGGQLKENSLADSVANCVIKMLGDHPSHQQCDLSVNEFSMLNDSVSIPNGFDTDILNQKSHLWRFQFHYHEFLLAQAANGNWDDANSFLENWLVHYAPEKVKYSDDAWHPYCISRRLVAWIWLIRQSHRDPALSSWSDSDSNLLNQMLDSSVQQANFLSLNLERDLGGNHLLENVTALAIASGTIDSVHAKQWSKIAADVLAVELPRQVLLHGEHFELSPMYHCQILSNLLRIEACCQQDQALLDIVSPVIDPMLKFLSSILHPDGEIPLLSDSGFLEAPSVQEIDSVAKLNERSLDLPLAKSDMISLGGYQIFRSDTMFGICDFGSIAAPKLPAHGHCDATNLEISIEGNRWIVDSGNFNYDDDAMRHYCRSSIGHNVVTVNDENQANVWSKFRMGDRPKIFGHQQGVRDQWHWATVSHNGYRKIGVPKLSRLVAFQDRSAFCFDQAVSSKPDKCDLIGYLHFHPNVTVTREPDMPDEIVRFRLSHGSTVRNLMVYADGVSTEQGWYCSGFGHRETATIIRYARAGFGHLGWMLHDFRDTAEIQCSSESIQIRIGDLNVSWTELTK